MYRKNILPSDTMDTIRSGKTKKIVQKEMWRDQQTTLQYFSVVLKRSLISQSKQTPQTMTEMF